MGIARARPPFRVTAGLVAPTFFVLALGASQVACAHGESEGDRRVKALSDELARVQADRDRVDQRLAALEVKQGTVDDGAAAKVGATPVEKRADRGAVTPSPLPTPPLRVVRLGPDGKEQAGESSPAAADEGAPVDDGGPRPTLRVVGHAGRRGAKASPDRIEQTLPPVSAALAPAADGAGEMPRIREGAARPSALDPEARKGYDAALVLVRSGKCTEALDAFVGFLLRYPDHPNADNAMYWRAECYAKMGDLPRAVEQLEGTLARFPLGNKVSDALLKLGMAYDRLGNHEKAQSAYARLLREYPRSEAAARIPRKDTEGKP